MNPRYEAVLAHYGVEATRTNPRSSHENGVVEQGHRRLKNTLDQALVLRGSRDFESEEEYREFVRVIVDRRNRLVRSNLKRERRHLRPLPPAPVPEYVNYRCRVRRWTGPSEEGVRKPNGNRGGDRQDRPPLRNPGV